MNTPRDTDEGRAKPSVWPVYVAAVVIGAVSVFLWLSGVANTYSGHLVPHYQLGRTFTAIHVFLGLVTVVGLVRLRGWAWWCAVGWTIAFLLTPGMAIPITIFFIDWDAASGVGFLIVEKISLLVLFGTPITLIMWPLATRRRLFFPRA